MSRLSSCSFRGNEKYILHLDARSRGIESSRLESMSGIKSHNSILQARTRTESHSHEGHEIVVEIIEQLKRVVINIRYPTSLVKDVLMKVRHLLCWRSSLGSPQTST